MTQGSLEEKEGGGIKEETVEGFGWGRLKVVDYLVAPSKDKRAWAFWFDIGVNRAML